MTILISFEVMTRKSVNNQQLQLQIAQQPDWLFRELSSDIAKAASLELLSSGTELQLKLFDNSTVLYRSAKNPTKISKTCLVREAQLPKSQKTITLPFPRLSQQQFTLRNGPSKRPIICLELQSFHSRTAAGQVQTKPFKWAFRPLKPQN